MFSISPLSLKLIDLAIEEDLLASDFSTDAIFGAEHRSSGYLLAKEELVLCGSEIFRLVFTRIYALSLGMNAELKIEFKAKDGDKIAKFTKFAEFSGPTSVLLKAERVALNFLQHLSGVATHTNQIVEALGSEVMLCNTRKTLPGMRELQHYAVRTGGGRSHRFNLGSGVILKDNHIAASGSIAEAVRLAKAHAPHSLRIEVECETLDMVKEALAAGADIIMLDNMSIPQMQEALDLIQRRAITEISGNVDLERAPSLSHLGVDYVSSGAITHSTKAADISMRFH